jgi:hypothetical protein
MAEVAEPGRGQQRVADSVRRHVTIRMTVQARFSGPEQAGQMQLTRRTQRVYVDSDPDAGEGGGQGPRGAS